MPAPGGSHLWLCALDDIDDAALLQGYRALLDDNELARLRRFVFADDRRRFLVSHALVRCVLSCYADIAPEKWRFVAGAHGKPALAADTCLPIGFNLSHSGAHALLAVSAGFGMTGVDIERHRSARDFHGLARRKFALAEQEHLRSCSESALVAEFHDIWSLKEAFVKATGEGLSRSLADFHFAIGRNEGSLRFAARAELEPEPHRWHFWCYRPDGAYSASLALRVRDAVDVRRPEWFTLVPMRHWHALDMPLHLCT